MSARSAHTRFALWAAVFALLLKAVRRFTKLGDVQVLARHQTLSPDLKTALAWFGGAKLPTGSTTVVSADGSRAERALQPGTGTTDIVIGAAGRRAVGLSDALIGQVSSCRSTRR